MPVIEVDHLTIRHGDLVAVDDVSFGAEAGRITVLLGPNGAGKTSTIECLEGFVAAASGSVRILGLDPQRDRAQLSTRVGIMLQQGGIYPSVRPIEILRLYEALYPNPRAAEELLEFVGLSDRARTPWRALSGGEQQRLSLALALMGRPEVVLLDEPTAGVDIAGRQLIRDLIRSLADDGVCVLLTTHDLAEIEVLADHIVIIDNGVVVADGATADIVSGADAAQFRFRADHGLDTASLGAAIGASVRELEPGTYEVSATPTPPIVAALTGWLAARNVLLGDLQAGRQGLEAVFLKLTSESSGAERRADSGRKARAARRTEREGRR
ncbi:MAG: ABC transporter ATP-binding protein [Actinobacteria bacterium]|nr:ABC transporter ATP-binding protein [Actinomycetota bacterium]